MQFEHRHACLLEGLLELVDAHIAQGRAGTLACKSYVAPPADWRRTGQGRETILFGVHVKCNKVQNAAVLPLPPLLEALLDRLEARGIFATSERPDTCCVNAYEVDMYLAGDEGKKIDTSAFLFPGCCTCAGATDRSNFVVKFPAEVTTHQRAALLGGMFLVEYTIMELKRQQEKENNNQGGGGGGAPEQQQMAR